MRRSFLLLITCLAIIIGGGAWLYLKDDTGHRPVAEAVYQCDNDTSIAVMYYEGPAVSEPQPGEPPIPTGSVRISLDEGPITELKQTLSASGVRYANEDETFVFWNKGDEALIMRNNEMDLEYTNCRAAQ